MNKEQINALATACRAHGAMNTVMEAYTEAERLIRLAMVHAEKVTGIAVYVRSKYDRIDQAIERSWSALREVRDGIEELIVELKQGTQ